MAINPSRQFRSRQIADAQFWAAAKRNGWVPSGYVSKADRAKEVQDYLNSSSFAGLIEDEGTSVITDRVRRAAEIRRTPYDPSRGLTGRYDPVTGDYKDRT